jgi:hypothetical protein
MPGNEAARHEACLIEGTLGLRPSRAKIEKFNRDTGLTT